MTSWKSVVILVLSIGAPSTLGQQAGQQAASQSAASVAAEAARNAAAKPESRISDQTPSKEDEFAASLRIQVIGDGVGVPPDFSRGMRVTIYGQDGPGGDGGTSPEGTGNEVRGEREPDTNQTTDNRRAPLVPGCYGLNAEGENCGQGQNAGDPVAARIKLGTQRSIDAAAPTNIRLRETGIALPACTEQSREGLDCQ